MTKGCPSSSRTATCATRPASSTASSAARSPTCFSGSRRTLVRSLRSLRVGPISQPAPALGQHRAEDLLHLVEVRLVADERRRELDHGVAAVVGPAVQPRVEQRPGQEAAQEALRLVVVERLAGALVLDELDAEEEAVPADVADDRQVQQPLPP